MSILVLGFFLCILTGVRGIDIRECEEKGFAPSLLCSSCDKLASFVGDSGRFK